MAIHEQSVCGATSRRCREPINTGSSGRGMRFKSMNPPSALTLQSNPIDGIKSRIQRFSCDFRKVLTGAMTAKTTQVHAIAECHHKATHA